MIARITLLIVFVSILAACNPQAASPTPTPTPDALALVTEAAAALRSATAFRMSVEQEGPDYAIGTEYGNVLFRRASAQYAAPGVMQASIRVLAAGLPIDVDVFSRGQEQWYRAIWTGNQWLHQPFAPGFNPETLIAEDTGFQAALNALTNLEYAGEQTLESGAQTYHLAATADGPEVNALLAGLIETAGPVTVDVYIDQTSRAPVRFVVTETQPLPESTFTGAPTTSTADPEPVVWIIDLHDYNADVQFDDPEAR